MKFCGGRPEGEPAVRGFPPSPFASPLGFTPLSSLPTPPVAVWYAGLATPKRINNRAVVGGGRWREFPGGAIARYAATPAGGDRTNRRNDPGRVGFPRRRSPRAVEPVAEHYRLVERLAKGAKAGLPAMGRGMPPGIQSRPESGMPAGVSAVAAVPERGLGEAGMRPAAAAHKAAHQSCEAIDAGSGRTSSGAAGSWPKVQPSTKLAPTGSRAAAARLGGAEST